MIFKPAFYATAFLGVFAVSGDVLAGGTEVEYMSSAVLKSALRGERISYRGRMLDGDSAAAFGEGYVFSIAERAQTDGVWCGLDQLAPHEMIAQVFDALPTMDDPDGGEPAGASIPNILAEIYSCDTTEGQSQ
ncbi:MAG: hypothetical protein ACK5M4_04450 [Pseudorhodobacter sp.]